MSSAETAPNTPEPVTPTHGAWVPPIEGGAHPIEGGAQPIEGGAQPATPDSSGAHHAGHASPPGAHHVGEASPSGAHHVGQTSASAPAGWYPDGTAPGAQRWWNGSSWTEHVHNDAAGHPSAHAASWGAAYPAGAGVAPGTSPYTPFVWLIALLPIVTAISLATWDPSGIVSSAVAQQSAAGSGGLGSRYAVTANLGPGYFVAVATGWLVVIATVVLAFFDHRALGRRGFAQRFHWAWSLLLGFGAIVYLIGRSVVVRRQVGRGMAVIWVYVGVYALGVVIVVVKFVVAFVPAMAALQR